MRHAILAVAIMTASATAALAQPGEPTLFVANNGNLEGSVTTYAINTDGSPRFIAKYVIGTTQGLNTNAYGIDITPSGRFVAVSHATSASINEQITMLRVNADGTLSPVGLFSTPDSPLDLLWMSDTVLAVTRTRTSGANDVITYIWDESAGTLTEADRESVPGFCAYLARHPNRRWLYAGESTSGSVTAFDVDPAGELTFISIASGGAYPLGAGVSPDGRWLYAGGGISSGGRAVVAFEIEEGGTLSVLGGSPFTSPGSSPKQVAVTDDGRFALVAHGTDATIRVLAVGADGSLTDTGFSYDVGFQGSLGELVTFDDLIFVTDRDTISDGVRGLQALRVGADGSLTAIGGRVDAQGSTPNQLAFWRASSPDCPADFNGDGFVDFFDFDEFVICFEGGACPPGASADFNDDGFVDFFDYDDFVIAFEAGC